MLMELGEIDEARARDLLDRCHGSVNDALELLRRER
jgi:hypothetical protein